MVQMLLSCLNIEIIVREFDFDIIVNIVEGYINLINVFSKNIRLDRIGRNNIYNIFYFNCNLEFVKCVVQEILDLFVEGSLGNNCRDIDIVSCFLDEQILEYEICLIEVEQCFVDFQCCYNDILLVLGLFYLIFQGVNSDLESI